MYSSETFERPIVEDNFKDKDLLNINGGNELIKSVIKSVPIDNIDQ